MATGGIPLNHRLATPLWRMSKVPKLLILTLLVYLVIASLYAHFVPPLNGYDGIAHFNYINFLRKERRLPQVNSEALQFSYELVQQPPLYYLASLLSNIGVPYDNADRYARSSANPYYGMGMGTGWTIVLPDTPRSYQTAMDRARTVSMLGGLLAVLGTWLWVNTLLPDRRWLATATACFVGLNPAFLFLATTVTNDSWAVAGSAITIWLITATARRQEFSWLRWFAIGCLAGLAALTKYSVLVVAIPAAVLLLIGFKGKGYGKLWLACLMLLAGGVTTAGFWYGRNLLAYGELVPLGQTAKIISTFRLPTPLSLVEIRAKLPWLFFSYWGVFGNVFAPARLLDFWKWFVIIGCVGLAIHSVRSRDRGKWGILVACSLWFLVALLSLLNWMRTIAFGDQARLLLVAAPAIALLLVLGWNALAPKRWENVLNSGLAGGLMIAALWPLPILAHAFAMPVPLAADVKPDHAVNARLDNGVEVIGYDLPGGRTLWPGAELPLTIYFAAEQAIAEDYTIFVHLVDENNNLLYQFDGVPFAGRHPTRQWKPGQRFADSYTLTASETEHPETLATVEMGFYPIGRPNERVTMYGASGQMIGDRLVLGKVRVMNSAPVLEPPAEKALATWSDQIRLVSANVDSDMQSGAYAVKAIWQAKKPMQTDYTVFMQLLDADNHVVGQIDQQPRGGKAPTSTWLAGETITDTYTMAIPASSWQRMIIGIYDGQTGQRLQLSDPVQRQDYFVVQTH
jgi:hypothetical protein